MKRFFSYLMVMATLVLGGGKAMAQSVTIDGVVYTVDGDHAYVSGNDGTVANVTVLDKVTINDVEYQVTRIGDSAFREDTTLVSIEIPGGVSSIGSEAFHMCSSLISINIPKGVTEIPYYAFDACTSLTTVVLPEGLTTIGYRAFHGCTLLSSVNIPSSVTYIGHYAFKWNNALKTLTLPSGITTIEDGAFANCTVLSSVVCHAEAPSYSNDCFSANSILFVPKGCYDIYKEKYPNNKVIDIVDGDDFVLNLFTEGGIYYANSYALEVVDKTLTEYTLKEGVTSIGDETFYGCTALTSLVLPETVASIGEQAFYNCSSLTSINIPSGITVIEDYTFYGCTSLTSISLPEGLTNIKEYAFYGCSNLEELYLPASLEIIDYHAFWKMYSLEKLELRKSFTITPDIFSDIDNLHTIICHSTTPPNIEYAHSITDYSYQRRQLGAGVVIYIPEGCYSDYNVAYPNCIIIDKEKEVDVTITIPGTLGEEVLTQVDYLRDINKLIVSGSINETDIACINNMENLLSLDLRGVDMEVFTGIGHNYIFDLVLPNNCKEISGLESRPNLKTVTLSDGMETIGNSCFSSCYNLEEITMPSALKNIGDNAFYNCKELKRISFNDALVGVGTEAFYGCSSLTEISFGDSLKNIGDGAFENCTALQNVKIREGLLHIGYKAFSNCPSLTSINIPSTLTVISEQLFYHCLSLSSIELHNGITNIGTSAFAGCNALSSIIIPLGVTTIDKYAFENCKSLHEVILHDNITSIGIYAFANCDSLNNITLPSTLTYCGMGAFSGSGLTEVTCPAFFPPITGGDLIGANNCTLYVPEWTLNRYKLANNWNLFASIEPISGIYPNSISVYTEESLAIPAEGLAADYKPNMEIVRYDNSNIGRFTVRGEGTLPLSSFKMQQTRDANTMTSLVNYGTLTADNVVTNIDISTNTWHFLTFPYDVKVSDIATVGNWVISRYDGAARAKEDFGNTWKTLPYDSILHAGEGYIWHSQGGNFTVPAVDNENKNLIFANDIRYIQLKENPSATEANYGWNLIGNPYPCFYDTRFMDFTSPITVRSGNSYAAYSPVDDSYILSPLEAFFVQCSAESNVVGFYTEGRQTDNTVRTLTSAPNTRTASERSVLNLYLESNAYADHTRLVVNEGASLAYEIACDAAKFMSDDATVPQLFTIEGGEHMAINERPLANGKAALGIYIGKAGNYTLSLDTKAMDTEVFLVDKLQGTETDLTTDSYAFTTEAGTFTDRFEIRMKRTGVVDGIEAVAAELKVEATADGISVSNATTPICIYNATGALIDIKTGNAVTFDVPQGVYVVKVGDNVHKVVVK